MMTMKKTLAAVGLLLLLQNAWAIDIRDAKTQGLVGEANTGFIVALQEPASAEVRALVAEVNGKRKARFNETARKTGVTPAQVAYRFYELAVQRTAPGHYYQDSKGQWRKK